MSDLKNESQAIKRKTRTKPKQIKKEISPEAQAELKKWQGKVENDLKQEAIKAAANPVRKYKERGMVSWIHELFKLNVAKCQTNVSWQQFKPRLVEVEHCHMYHTTDQAGKHQDKCSPIAGHFHYVKPKLDDKGVELLDAEGYPVMECSPPMRQVRTKMKSGSWKKKVEQVQFATDDGFKYDNHKHDFDYIGAETLQPKHYKVTPNVQDRYMNHLAHAQETLKDAGIKATEKR